MNALGNLAQYVVLLIALCGGGVLFGHKYGPWEGAFAALSLVAILLLAGSIRAQREIDTLTAVQRPHLVFGATHIHSARVNQYRSDGTVHASLPGRFPIITLANDPPENASAVPDATDVVVHLDLETLDGERLDGFIARCADTDEAVFGAASKKEHTELNLAPNGRYWSYNTVVLIDGEGTCRPWNNHSMRDLDRPIGEDNFRIVATARGSNARASATFEVTTFPLAIRKVAD